MGGLGPGIGGSEWFVIGLVALLVVGPERLPGLLRQLGKWVTKARGMANEFRSSFEDMARQSELDELRKEVEALRTGQPVRLGADADAAFKDIKAEFDKPLFTPSAAAETPLAEPVMTPAASEWPDGEPVMLPVADSSSTTAAAVVAPAKSKAKALAKPRAAKATPVEPASAKTRKPAASKSAASKSAPRKAAPRNSKIDL